MAADEFSQQHLLAGLSRALEAALTVPVELDPWANSPYGWIKTLPSAGRGKAGELLCERWLTSAGRSVSPRRSTQHDRVIDGLAAEIKLSTLWTNGLLVFQQIRDQDYEILVLVGVLPDRVNVWVVPKQVALAHVTVGQHTGAAGTDTFWLKFDASRPPAWLAPYGGTLEEALTSLDCCVVDTSISADRARWRRALTGKAKAC